MTKIYCDSCNVELHLAGNNYPASIATVDKRRVVGSIYKNDSDARADLCKVCTAQILSDAFGKLKGDPHGKAE